MARFSEFEQPPALQTSQSHDEIESQRFTATTVRFSQSPRCRRVSAGDGREKEDLASTERNHQRRVASQMGRAVAVASRSNEEALITPRSQRCQPDNRG